ncbi:MAG: hypothetical protein ACRCXT_02060 [Paraclostridium sp.]
MSFSYSNTITDYQIGIRILNEVVLSRRIAEHFLPAVIIPIIGVFLFIDLWSESAYLEAIYVFLVGVASIISSFTILHKQVQKRTSKKVAENKKILSLVSLETTISLEKSSLLILRQGVSKCLEFSDIKHFIVKEGRIIIIGNENKLDAIIPITAFSSDSDLEKFIKKIKTSSS